MSQVHLKSMGGCHQQYSIKSNPPIPLIPRLKQMWRLSEIARMLTGYTKYINDDNIVHYVVDNPTWKHINTDITFDNFGSIVRTCDLL